MKVGGRGQLWGECMEWRWCGGGARVKIEFRWGVGRRGCERCDGDYWKRSMECVGENGEEETRNKGLFK